MALWEVLVATQMQVRFRLAPAAAERKTAGSSTYGEFVEMILVKAMFGNEIKLFSMEMIMWKSCLEMKSSHFQ